MLKPSRVGVIMTFFYNNIEFNFIREIIIRSIFVPKIYIKGVINVSFSTLYMNYWGGEYQNLVLK